MRETRTRTTTAEDLTPEQRLFQLGFRTKGFPDHIRTAGLEVLGRIQQGATIGELKGHRHHQNRDAVVVPVHRDYVIVCLDTPAGLKPAHFVTRQRYDKMFR